MSRIESLGIDFGTSNSAVATSHNGEVRLFETEASKHTQPSSIFIRADGYHSTSFQAVDDFLGQGQSVDNSHFIPSIKPGLSLDKYEGIALPSRNILRAGRPAVHFFEVEELASYVISDLKEKSESQSNTYYRNVVLGRPVRFSLNTDGDSLAENRLRRAAEISGFKSIEFVMEPVAAALYYERSRLGTDAKNVFVLDFGGGTLDTCILELNSQKAGKPLEPKSKVLAAYGIPLGGNDLDKDLFSRRYLDYFGRQVTWGDKNLSMPGHIFNEVTEWHLVSPTRKRDLLHFLTSIFSESSDREAIGRLRTLIKDQQVYAILKAIEEAKIELSGSATGHVEFNYEDIGISDQFSTVDFESAVSARTREIQDCINETLASAQLKSTQIDAVLKVGGSSNNRFVDSILRRNFEVEVEEDSLFTSVVAGLSLAAETIFT